MTAPRTHRVPSRDGTEVVASVHGEGPPVVFVHGVTGDGDLDWTPIVSHMSDRFTCYLMSTRGRGQSAQSDDHTKERLVEDISALIDSVGEPVGLVGFSYGGALSLAVASQHPAVRAVAAYEPALIEAINEGDLARFQAAVGSASKAVGDGRLADGMRAFLDCVCTPDELSQLSEAGYVEDAAPDAPAMVRDIVHGTQSALSLADPARLATIQAPTLLTFGPNTTMQWFLDSVRHAEAHIPDARVHELPGAAHFAPVLEPDRVAGELVPFFGETLRAA
jgi:pimeloyl-ACP methyl ester carboxylesterase